MSDLGVYFGPNAINISESKGRKLANNIQIPLAGIIGNELDEKVPAEIKLVAAFNDSFRRNKVEAKEVTLCLSGKDLIVRTFEIPVLPREELQGAINFEAKKYIPFKVEELISAYQVEFDRLNRTNMVLFMGIKKDTFEKYSSIFKQLNLKLNAIEYAGFSLSRILKLAGAKESGVTGVLCFDSLGQDEINFTVLENGFPLFSRDINLGSAPSDLDQITDASASFSPDKLKTEMRVSLDYYHRKFPAKDLKSIFLVSSPERRQEFEVFIGELGLISKFVDLSRVIAKPLAFSSGLAKSYSASIFKSVPAKVKLDLVESKAKAVKAGAKEPLAWLSLLTKIKLDFRVITAGILICAATAVYGVFQAMPFKQDLAKVMSKRNKDSKFSPDTSYDALKASSLKYKVTLGNLDNLIKNQLFFTEALDILPRSLPQGAWLSKLSLSQREGNRAELILEGMCYLGDSNNEFQAVNKFFADLNASPVFTKYFKDIRIVSIGQAQFASADVTTFYISCKTYKEKK